MARVQKALSRVPVSITRCRAGIVSTSLRGMVFQGYNLRWSLWYPCRNKDPNLHLSAARFSCAVHLLVLAVGKIRERYFKEGIEKYLVRLRPYASVKVVEVKDHAVKGTTPAELASVREAEGRALLRALPADCQAVALDPGGELWSSSQFAGKLKQWEITGPHTVVFIIGGELGLSDEVKQRCIHQISLSSMTFPHQLVRLILLEQLYRSFRIIRGEPYHR